MGSAAETLLRVFWEISGERVGVGALGLGVGDSVAESGQELAGVLTDVVREVRVAAAAPPKSDSGGGVVDTLESVGSTIFKNALGVAPLIRGIVSLFGGGDSEAPPPLVKFALPAAVNFLAAETADGFAAVDYDQAGRPRAIQRDGERVGGTASVTVNVQAMDARSFLDRSTEIAAAVREAMLNLNSINDVVNEL